MHVEVESLNGNPSYCKCPRCFKFHRILENFEGLCDRCVEVILEWFPAHESVPSIKVALQKQRKKYEVGA